MATVTKTIKADGTGDYATISGWAADLDSTSIYASGDDAVGSCFNAGTFDESVTIDGGGTVGLNSVTLTVASGERHDGTAGSGARVVLSSDASAGIISIEDGTAPDRNIEWLEVDANGNDARDLIDVFENAKNHSVRWVIAHGTSIFNSADNDSLIKLVADDGSYVANCIAYDLEETYDSPGPRYGVYTAGNADAASVFNTTIHDVRMTDAGATADLACLTANDLASKDVQNVVCTDPSNAGSGAADCFEPSSFSNTNASHNASSDGTAPGSNSLTNITTADQYVSTMDGFEDLHIQDTSADIYQAGTDLGTTPSGVELDIDGYDRDANNSTWSIGADQGETLGATATDFPFGLYYGGGLVG